MTPEKIVDVGAAVIIRPDGSFLLAERPVGKVYAGYWEFPGGKVEAGETPLQGLARELQEEIGIEIETAYPWLTQVFTYPHATVRLHFFRVTAWHGEPHGRENQRIAWQRLDEQPLAPMLPANTPIFRALNLPAVYAITNAQETGEIDFLNRLRSSLNHEHKLLVQVREKSFTPIELSRFAQEVNVCCRSSGTKVLINSDLSLAGKIGADGVHLTSAQLVELKERPNFSLVGASCHDRRELDRAIALNVDFAVLGPVMPTKSHPGAITLGWEAFAELASNRPIPIYAIGGLQSHDLVTAWQAGAHGIAMQRAVW
ncbi:MAG: Nudix family hydrolase [Pseudomonadota bacterium]